MQPWEAAVQVMRSAGKNQLTCVDIGMIRRIALLLGWKISTYTEHRVVDYLDRHPGPLIKKKTLAHTGPGVRHRYVRLFRLPADISPHTANIQSPE